MDDININRPGRERSDAVSIAFELRPYVMVVELNTPGDEGSCCFRKRLNEHACALRTRRALERAGIIFIDGDYQGAGGPGIRLGVTPIYGSHSRRHDHHSDRRSTVCGNLPSTSPRPWIGRHLGAACNRIKRSLWILKNVISGNPTDSRAPLPCFQNL